MTLQVPALAAIALCCFAANSILCRLALAEGHIDAATFTAVRVASGALVLSLLALRRPRRAQGTSARWVSAALLFAYAAPFSFAYLRLGAAMGALILFASVQVTMIGWGVSRGERPGVVAWLGILVALVGLVALTAPGAAAPDAPGAVLMAAAGVAWGAYSLRGRTAGSDPLETTASSFVRALPFSAALVAAALAALDVHATSRGIVLAVLSGALASGVGYAVWYAALPGLSRTRAAVLQLLVPILAAAGAVTWLGEAVSPRLVVASGAILGGVALTIVGGRRPAR
jgi:drug/metabolite transporter (DMT)-like permease